jgi:hypothetical protein
MCRKTAMAAASVSIKTGYVPVVRITSHIMQEEQHAQTESTPSGTVEADIH